MWFFCQYTYVVNLCSDLKLALKYSMHVQYILLHYTLQQKNCRHDSSILSLLIFYCFARINNTLNTFYGVIDKFLRCNFFLKFMLKFLKEKKKNYDFYIFYQFLILMTDQQQQLQQIDFFNIYYILFLKIYLKDFFQYLEFGDKFVNLCIT